MKKLLTGMLIFFSFYAVSSALEPIKVAIFNPDASGVSITVEAVDLDAGSQYGPVTLVGTFDADDSGILSFRVGVSDLAWQGLEAANIDGRWVLNVSVGGTLYAQYRLDQLIMSQGAGLLNMDASGNLVPDEDNTQSLGTSTNRWSDVFVGPQTMHVGVDGDEATIGFDTANDELEFSINGSQEVVISPTATTFNGNVDATQGLDVTGANLTAGSTNINPSTGDVSVGGTLSSAGDFDVNSNFNINAATGNTDIQGNLTNSTGNLVVENAHLEVSNNDNTARQIRLQEPSGSGTNYISLESPALAANESYTLPTADGSNGDVLTTDGAGAMSWTTPAGGGGGGCNIFGDGSAGDVTISANTDWSTTPPTNGNYMFNNLTINSGITLTVASGTVIQVAGTFTNNGTIEVKTGVLGRAWFGNADGGVQQALGNTLTERRAYPSEVLRRMTKLGPKGGSGGSIGSGSSENTFGGNGGGTLTILASSGLSNAGTINAQGQDSPALPGGSTKPGVGGGGGGYLLLASNGNISNSGTIDVSAGSGSDAGDASGDRGGSGGGGGLIHYISPNANAVAGTNTISGGAVGVSDGTGDSGGSGGAGAGDGGYGGSFPSIAPNPGSSGVLLRTQVNDACAFINN